MQPNKSNTEVLRTGQFAGLHFEQGWWFLQVLDTEFIELKPWILLNDSGNREAIPAESVGSEDDEIEDTRGRKYLIPKNQEQDLVFQVKFGIAPSRMQLYPFFGRDRSPNLVGNAEPGEPQVPYTGFDTPYNNPSPEAEVFTVNSQPPLSLQAYNPMDEAAEARVSFHVNKMKYAVVESVDLMKAMLQGQQPSKKVSMGLGAQRTDRFRAPEWLMDTFGENVLTTAEILEQGQTGGQNGEVGLTLPGVSQLS